MLSYGCFYGDYGGIAHVDFRVRRFGDRTFAFVFMYVRDEDHQETIQLILDSFAVPPPDPAKASKAVDPESVKRYLDSFAKPQTGAPAREH